MLEQRCLRYCGNTQLLYFVLMCVFAATQSDVTSALRVRRAKVLQFPPSHTRGTGVVKAANAVLHIVRGGRGVVASTIVPGLPD